MVTRSHTFAPGEWYHCYTRGIEKQTVFKKHPDYARFLELLYIANATNTIHRSNLGKEVLKNIYDIPRQTTKVAIGAFCLMPNHFHLLLKESQEGGISSFMLKLMTGYSMYFNIHHEHEGSVFSRPFRSQHVSNDRYFQHVIDYIHCNPAEIFEPAWKKGVVKNMQTLQEKLIQYPYSSAGIFYNQTRPEQTILDPEVFTAYNTKPLNKMLKNVLHLYQGVPLV